MTSSTESASSVTENVTISCEVQSMISTAANLLEMTHFLSSLSIIHVLLGLELLPLDFLAHSIHLLLLVLDGKHFLRLFILVLLILLLINKSLSVIIDGIHVTIHGILVGSLLERWSILIFTHVIVSLTESVRGSLMHLVGALHLGLTLPSWTRSTSRLVSSTQNISRCSVRSLRSMCRVSQTLTFINLLINMRKRILQVGVVSVLLLIEWSHSELLVRECLILSSRWSFFFRTRSQDGFMLSWLDSNEAIPFFENVHFFATTTEPSDGFAEELI